MVKIVEGAISATLAPISAEITLRQKSAFAVQHLMAAARFSRMCGKIEQENSGKPFGGFFDEQIACVSATVLLSTASLESNINEYLSEIDSNFPELNDQMKKEAFDLIEKKGVLEKYQFALAFKGKEKMLEGEQPFQDASALIKIRNALVHFKPEWHDEQKEHKKLEKLLSGKFTLNPSLASDGVFFPQRCISYGCTQWSVKSAFNFMKKFSELSGLALRFDKHQGKFDTEI